MLDALRTATKGWIGRSLMTILMGLIILSFAIWGIGDIFRGFGADQLAQVGDIEIGADAYRNAYQTELQRLQRQRRRSVTNDEARQLGIDRQVLARLISEAALDHEARKLDLAMSDQDVGRKIADDPTFKGINGKFDRQRFDAVLRDNGLSEKSYLSEQRGQFLRHQVTDALIHGLEMPKALLAAIHHYLTETRSVDYIVLPATSAGVVPTPSEDDLQKYFDDRREAHRVLEYRGLMTFALSPNTLAKPETVSEADARKRYDEVKAERFGTPEKRTIEQILFTEEPAARAARASLDAGKTWDALLAEKKLTQKDVSLGTLAREGLADTSAADAAFELSEGSVSGPVKTQFGTVLVRVTKIFPANIKPFADVAQDLQRDIAVQRARGEVARLHDLVEDQRAAGKSLIEATQSVGLEPRAITAIDTLGNDPQGVPVPDLTNGPALLKAAFASDIGVDNDTLRLPEGGYQWFEITKIEPARQKTFADVRPEVEKAWRDDQTASLLSAKATDLVKRLEAGETIAAIAASEGNLEVEHVGDVKRGINQNLAPNIVTQIFNVGVRGAGSAEHDGGSRILFQVLDSVVPVFDPADPSLATVSNQVKTGIVEDVVAQYLTKLQNELGVRVNPKAFASVTGAAPDSY